MISVRGILGQSEASMNQEGQVSINDIPLSGRERQEQQQRRPSEDAPDPRSGNITIEAVIVSDDAAVSRDAGSENPMDILGGDIIVSVAAKDPQTGEIVHLEGVRVRQTPGTLVGGISEGRRVSIKCPSYAAFKNRRTGVMEAYPSADRPVVQNQALPTPVRHRDCIDSFTNSPSPVCRQFRAMEEQARRHMGMVFDRDDLSILQGSANGRSPGVLVHQSNGQVMMFDNSGQQHISMDGERVSMVASEIEMGQARIGKNAPGYPIPMEENRLNHYVPQGTILQPQPSIIPNITRALATINMFMDFIDLYKCCKQAVDVMQGDPSPQEKQELLNQAGESTFVNAVYRDNQESDDERQGRTTSQYDRYRR